MPSAVTPVRRALVSVHDKTGVAELGRALAERGVELVSTGGTAAHLKEAGIAVALVEEKTGFPEILGGRVKTLHPKIFGGVLADDTREDHARDLAETAIEAFDLVIVNLYPFEKTVAAGKSRPEVVEMIDVGGPAMIRAAAKNHARVAVVVDPADYAAVLEEIRLTGGTKLSTRETARRPRVLAHGGLRRRHRGLLRELRPRALRLPGEPRLRVRPARRAPLRREPAPAGGALRLSLGAGRRPRALPDAPGQGALVQQPARSRLRRHAGPRLRGARGRHREAQQPLRSGRRRDHLGGLRPRLRVRSARGLRRHHRDPGQGGRRARLARPPALRRGRRRRRLHRGGARLLRQEAQHPAPARSGLAPARLRARLEADRGRPAPPGRGLRARPEHGVEGRLAAQAHGRRARGLRARLEGRAPGQVERDRARERPPDASASARGR